MITIPTLVEGNCELMGGRELGHVRPAHPIIGDARQGLSTKDAVEDVETTETD